MKKTDEKKFIMISEKGLVASGTESKEEIMAMILYAFLDMWCETKYEVDINEATKAILKALYDVSEEEEDDDADADADEGEYARKSAVDLAFEMLFGDDDDDESNG